MALDIAKLEEEIKEEQQQTEDKPPKAMEELYNLLQQLGSAWREDTTMGFCGYLTWEDGCK